MRRRSWVKEVRRGWIQEGEEHKESSLRRHSNASDNAANATSLHSRTSASNRNTAATTTSSGVPSQAASTSSHRANSHHGHHSHGHGHHGQRRQSLGHSSRNHTGHFRTNTKSSVMSALAGFTRATQLFNKHSQSNKDLNSINDDNNNNNFNNNNNIRNNKKSVPSHKSPIKRTYRDRSLFAKAKRHQQLYNSHPHNNVTRKENKTNDANVAECLNQTVLEKPASAANDTISSNDLNSQNTENDNINSNTIDIAVTTERQPSRITDADDFNFSVNKGTTLRSVDKRDEPTVTKIHVAKQDIPVVTSQNDSRRSSLISTGSSFQSSAWTSFQSNKYSFDSSSAELKSNDEDISALFEGSAKAVSKKQTEKIRKQTGILEDISEEYGGYSEPIHGTTGEYIGSPEFSGEEIYDPYQWDDLLERSKTELVIVEVYSEYFGPCNVMNPFIDEILNEYHKNLGEIRTQSENLDENTRCRLPIYLARIDINDVEQKLHRELRLLGHQAGLTAEDFQHIKTQKLPGLEHNSSFESPIPTYAFFKDGLRITEMKGANANKLKKLIDIHCHQTPKLTPNHDYYETVNIHGEQYGHLNEHLHNVPQLNTVYYDSSSESLSSAAFTNASSSANELYVKYKPIFHLRNQSLAETKRYSRSNQNSRRSLGNNSNKSRNSIISFHSNSDDSSYNNYNYNYNNKENRRIYNNNDNTSSDNIPLDYEETLIKLLSQDNDGNYNNNTQNLLSSIIRKRIENAGKDLNDTFDDRKEETSSSIRFAKELLNNNDNNNNNNKRQNIQNILRRQSSVSQQQKIWR